VLLKLVAVTKPLLDALELEFELSPLLVELEEYTGNGMGTMPSDDEPVIEEVCVDQTDDMVSEEEEPGAIEVDNSLAEDDEDELEDEFVDRPPDVIVEPEDESGNGSSEEDPLEMEDDKETTGGGP